MLYINIKRMCEEKKTSISSVEKAAGLSNGTIGKWKDSDALASSVVAVAKVLGVSVEKLME